MASGEPQEISEGGEEKFENFDIVSDHSDHYYYICQANQKERTGIWSNNARDGTFKRIMQEWRILKKNLPETIFVRVYEGRIDLLRAVIIGAQNTPYHDGLFFFDICFPSNYPDVPPKVHYYSHGLSLNPNLYPSGYVCLSLLNTWQGSESEKWNPATSTILQVLVSIQGIVLNEKPYHNEPVMEPSRSWTAFNEVVFAMSCKNMLSELQNPPKYFEPFVVQHFKERANNILRACYAYRHGCVEVGFYSGDTADAASSQHKKTVVSSNFRSAMDNFYPELYMAFVSIGAPLDESISERRVIGDEKKKKHGIFYKFMRCLGF